MLAVRRSVHGIRCRRTSAKLLSSRPCRMRTGSDPTASVSRRSSSRPSRTRAAGPPSTGARRDEQSEQVTSPTKLIRIASMVRTMLDEVRRAPLDDAGRRRLREIHEKSLEELEGVLSPDLRQELSEVVLPLTGDDPASRSSASHRRSWWDGSRDSSTGSRPRCSPSRRWRSRSSRRCGGGARSRAVRWAGHRSSPADTSDGRLVSSELARLPGRAAARVARRRRARVRARRAARGTAARVRRRGAQPHR